LLYGKKKSNTKEKKIGIPCYYGQNFTPSKDSSVCVCTIHDYECMQCFGKERWNDRCTLQCETSGLIPRPDDQCKLSTPENPIYYDENIGYEKIHASACREESPAPKGRTPCDIKFQKDESPTSPSTSNPAEFALVFIMILLVVAVILAGLWYNWKHNEKFHNWVIKTFAVDEGEDIVISTPDTNPGGSVALSISSDENTD